MDTREKVLYHQIHPAKLATDIAVTAPCLILLWDGQLLAGILVTLPSAVASALVLRYADLERLKASRAGGYLARHMSPAIQAARGLGFILMAVGAWFHTLGLIPVGLVIVLIAWFYGLVLRGATPDSP